VVVLTMARRGSNPAGGGCGVLILGVLAIGLAIMIIKWALITAAILAVPFGVWWLVDHHQQRQRGRDIEARDARRAEIEGRAVVDAASGCGWCGSRIAHRDQSGTLVMPREHHREEIDEAIALAGRSHV
jgi:hypothetical protein